MSHDILPTSLIIRKIETLSEERFEELTTALGKLGLEVEPVFAQPEPDNFILPEHKWVPLQRIYTPEGEPDDYAITKSDVIVCAESFFATKSERQKHTSASRAWNMLLRQGFARKVLESDPPTNLQPEDSRSVSFNAALALTETDAVHSLPTVGEKTENLIRTTVANKAAQIEAAQQKSTIQQITQ